jgi:RNA polymerase sigma-70 factor (ECF subfamily)
MWETSDEAVFAGYATGDPDAAVVFIRRFQARVFGLALSLTHDRTDAEEIAQDAFVRAWRYASSYDARRGSVSSWLLRIVRNVALDRLRVTARRAEVATTDGIEAWLVDGDNASEAVERADGVRRVIDLVRVLPVEQRDALFAVTLHGLSAREYSDATGTPLGTVKTRIRLALRKLRGELGASMR